MKIYDNIIWSYKSVGLTSLVERRERGDLIEAFKTIKGFNRVDRDQWFQFRNHEETRATRSTVSVTNGEQTTRNDVLFKESVRLDSRKNFFTVRVTNKWNDLPEEIKSQKSVNSFKNRYDSWNRSRMDRQQQQSWTSPTPIDQNWRRIDIKYNRVPDSRRKEQYPHYVDFRSPRGVINYSILFYSYDDMRRLLFMILAVPHIVALSNIRQKTIQSRAETPRKVTENHG